LNLIFNSCGNVRCAFNNTRDRFVFVFCLYFSHLFRPFSRQNGPSIWHKRFLRLLCTSKEKKGRFRGVFSFLLYIFFSLPSPTDPSRTRLYYIHLTLIHRRQQRVQLLHIFFTLRYKIPLVSLHAIFPFRKHNANRYDGKDISLRLLGVRCINVFAVDKGCIFNHADFSGGNNNICICELFYFVAVETALFILCFISSLPTYKTIIKLFYVSYNIHPIYFLWETLFNPLSYSCESKHCL